MHPNTPAHLVYKEPLVPGDIIWRPVQQSQDGRPSERKPPPWSIIGTIMTSYSLVNRIALGLDPSVVPVLFRPTINVYLAAASLMFSGAMFIGHLAPEFAPQLAAALAIRLRAKTRPRIAQTFADALLMRLRCLSALLAAASLQRSRQTADRKYFGIHFRVCGDERNS